MSSSSRLRLFSALARLTAAVFIQRRQHQLDDVRPVEFVAEAVRREEVGGLLPAAIDVPADQFLGAGRGHVIALRRPGDPAPILGLHEQRQQLLAVGEPEPAYGAVAAGHQRRACRRR